VPASYQVPLSQQQPAALPAQSTATVRTPAASSIRIVPPPAEFRAEQAPPAKQVAQLAISPDPVMRVTAAGGAQPAQPSASPSAVAPTNVQLTVAAPNVAAGVKPVQKEAAREEVAESVEPSGYDSAPDYSWLSGRLEYSQTSRQWKLRYIPIDGQTDQYGGSVKLVTTPALSSFNPGDMVKVRGALASGSTTDGFAPLYQLAHIEPLAR
jgi:hypothetical protein